MLFEMETRSAALISSSHRAIQTFLSEATTMGIRVPRILELGSDQPDNQVEDFLRHMNQAQGPTENNNVVVLLAGPGEAARIAEHLRHVRLPGRDPTWLVGSLGLDLVRMSAWRGVFHGGVFVQPHTPELREFKKYFVSALKDKQGSSDLIDLIDEYKEETFGCTLRKDASSDFLMPCDHIPESEIEMRFRQDPQVSFVVKAVSALTAAFRLAQLDRCADGRVESSCLRKVRGGDELHESILGNLRKLSFSPPVMRGDRGSGGKEVEGTQHHFTRNGRLVANKQQVYSIDRYSGLKQVTKKNKFCAVVCTHYVTFTLTAFSYRLDGIQRMKG